MQSVRSRILTRVAVSISYDDNDYTTGTSSVITILIKVYLLHGSFWFSLAIHPYRSLLFLSLLHDIPRLHKAGECKFLLVAQHWYVHE